MLLLRLRYIWNRCCDICCQAQLSSTKTILGRRRYRSNWLFKPIWQSQWSLLHYRRHALSYLAWLQLMCYQKSITQAGSVVLAPLILLDLSCHYWINCILKDVPRCTQSQLSSIWTDARFLVRDNISPYIHGAVDETLSKFDRKQRDRARAHYYNSYSTTRGRSHCANH